MRDQTRALLDEMIRWPWFEYTGLPTSDSNLVTVDSWDKAFRLCTGDLWASVTLQATNRFSYEVSMRDWYRGDTWNAITDAVKQDIYYLVDVRKIFHSIPTPWVEGFVNQVKWDILMISMETEFSDIYSPILYANILARWYRAGHFPCGWDGPMLESGWNGPLPPHRLYVY